MFRTAFVSTAAIQYKDSRKWSEWCVPSISKPTARSPIKFEGTIRVRDQLSVELQRLGGSGWIGEVDEAIAGITTGISTH